jgi:hypothetical protein
MVSDFCLSSRAGTATGYRAVPCYPYLSTDFSGGLSMESCVGSGAPRGQSARVPTSVRSGVP